MEEKMKEPSKQLLLLHKKIPRTERLQLPNLKGSLALFKREGRGGRAKGT
jgi:hypothetical protein